MRRLAGVSLWIVCVLGLGAACTPEAEGNEGALCTAVCRCTEPTQLPARVDACVTECVEDAQAADISDACVECVFLQSQACGALAACFADGGPCDEPEPPVEG